MKKAIMVLALVLVVTGGVFAQARRASNNTNFKNWFSGEISILGAGIRYERMVNQNVGLGINVYFDTLILWHDLGADFSIRAYPWGKKRSVVRGLFFGGSVGFHVYWGGLWGYGYGYGYGSRYRGGYGGYFGNWSYPLLGGAIAPDIGWRLDVGKPGKFFIEPGIKMPFILGGYIGGGFGFGFNFVPYIGLGTAW